MTASLIKQTVTHDPWVPVSGLPCKVARSDVYAALRSLGIDLRGITEFSAGPHELTITRLVRSDDGSIVIHDREVAKITHRIPIV